MNSRRMSALRTARLALAAGAAACAAGCAVPGQMAGVTALPVDSSSPVARDVVNASRHPGPYPKFASIPKTPTDIRPAAEWRVAVADIERRKAELEAQAAALPAPQTDTQAFASQNLSKAPSAGEAPAPDQAAQTESYAKTLRERATPPPSPK